MTHEVIEEQIHDLSEQGKELEARRREIDDKRYELETELELRTRDELASLSHRELAERRNEHPPWSGERRLIVKEIAKRKHARRAGEKRPARQQLKRMTIEQLWALADKYVSDHGGLTVAEVDALISELSRREQPKREKIDSLRRVKNILKTKPKVKTVTEPPPKGHRQRR